MRRQASLRKKWTSVIAKSIERELGCACWCWCWCWCYHATYLPLWKLVNASSMLRVIMLSKLESWHIEQIQAVWGFNLHPTGAQQFDGESAPQQLQLRITTKPCDGRKITKMRFIRSKTGRGGGRSHNTRANKKHCRVLRTDLHVA